MNKKSMKDYITPAVAIMVGVATGIYTFQPLVLEQLKKDGNLNPKFEKELELARQEAGDLTNSERKN